MKKIPHGLGNGTRNLVSSWPNKSSKDDFWPLCVCEEKKYENGNFIILLLYVNDMLIVIKIKETIDEFKKVLNNFLIMKDMDAVKNILGMKIIIDRSKIIMLMSQKD